MLGRVYIETTIPSFYYEVVTSEPVLEELERGTQPEKSSALDLLSGTRILPIEEPVAEIVDAYVDHHVMPADPRGDAMHLALASYYHCRFLLTWNCVHLANANKFDHIRYVNSMLGLFVPMIVTPVELLRERV